MQALQRIGQLLVESKPLPALEQLRDWAAEYLPAMVNDIELQMARVNMVTKDFQQGLMTLPEYRTNLLQINKGIMYLLDQCKQGIDTGVADPGGAALHEYHAYTCDRIAHSDTFRDLFQKHPEAVQFYFLYGGDLQSHEGLFRRIAYDLEGRLQDYLNPELQTRIQALQLEMTFEFSSRLEHYQQNILRSFFSMLGLPPNEHEPLLEKDLAYALRHSPRLHDLRPTDYVCAYLHISQYDWDATLTPAAGRWFIREFCRDGKVDAPANLLFFLAIEYDEEDTALRDEIVSALTDAEVLRLLPELDMVPTRDIGSWLERYKQVSPNSRTRKDVLKNTFGAAREHYMEDVELELKKIIDRYNNNLLQ